MRFQYVHTLREHCGHTINSLSFYTESRIWQHYWILPSNQSINFICDLESTNINDETHDHLIVTDRLLVDVIRGWVKLLYLSLLIVFPSWLQHFLSVPKGHPGSSLSRRVSLSRGDPVPFHLWQGVWFPFLSWRSNYSDLQSGLCDGRLTIQSSTTVQIEVCPSLCWI